MVASWLQLTSMGLQCVAISLPQVADSFPCAHLDLVAFNLKTSNNLTLELTHKFLQILILPLAESILLLIIDSLIGT